MKLNPSRTRARLSTALRTAGRSWSAPVLRRFSGDQEGQSGRGLPHSKTQASLHAGLRTSAFTLIEMLVVIGIIGVILAIAIPSMRQREGSEMEAAGRQLVADLNIARARAIGARTTVAMVFVPPEILNLDPDNFSPQATQEEKETVRNLQAGPYTCYAPFAFRRVGDQPGRNTPRYLEPWRTLPEKTFIATNKYDTNFLAAAPFDYAYFPFPLETSQTYLRLPYIAYNYEGRLCQADGDLFSPPAEARIPLARGAVLYVRNAYSNVVASSFSVQEVPPGNSVTSSNVVVVDWLTGRARLQRAEIQSVP
jgi:prepilin-type N-terminal cleavage/methylation domain-containing protein